MVTVYRTITLSAEANENLIPKIYEILHREGRIQANNFMIDFVAFEAPSGTTFSINSSPLEVPSTGKFFTPYSSSSECMKIHTLTFDEGITDMKFYIIY